MSRPRIALITSLSVLGVLFALAFLEPMANPKELGSEVQRVHLLEYEDHWVISFDIINHEGRAQDYVIDVSFDDRQFCDYVLIHDGEIYNYMCHIYPQQITEGEVCCTICKKGEDTPIEEVNYYLK
ncbi:MAG: hypothetical protein JSU76_01525 [Dehalococcoidia bacterium]|nr:MAG: hypothetical protein JSU76_01525 [Dehalococcoidia bacterium]